MTERTFRFILGFSMIMFLFLEWHFAIYGILCILIIEGATNWRIPILISKLRYRHQNDKYLESESENDEYKINLEAERMLRPTVALFIALGFIVFPQHLWFLPWFVGLNLLIAGATGVCALVLFYRKIGLR